MRLSEKSHFGLLGAMPGLDGSPRVLLIAADLWKLGNRDCTTDRLLTSPAFPHSHFQRFQRFWSVDSVGAGKSVVRALSLSLSPCVSFFHLTESVMGLQPLLFIAEADEMLDRAVLICRHANLYQYVLLLNSSNSM